MRIDGWHIEGFGLFRDRHLEDLPPGLTLFLGPNESGKSTLLAFLRTVLFGFPARKAKELYPPLTGGSHGGRIFLDTPEGAVTIERLQHRKKPAVRLSSGAELTESDLRSLLGGVDASLFRSVFAFSLHELSDLDSLAGDDISDRIFSAGIAGAGRSARQVIKQLDRETGELLRPRKGGTINDLLAELEGLRQSLATARSRTADYATLLGREREAAQQVDIVRRETDQKRAEEKRFSLLCDLWSTWVERREAERALAELEAPESFPEGAEELLGRRIAAGDTARQALEELTGELTAGRESLQCLTASLNEAFHEVAAEVHEHALALQVQRQRLEEIPRQREKLAAAETVYEDARRDLGPGWSDTRVDSFDTSQPVQVEIEGWESAFRERETALKEAEQAHAVAAGSRRSAIGRRDEVAAELEVLRRPEPEDLRIRKDLLRRLRANYQETRSLEADLRGDRASVNDLRYRLTDAERAAADSPLLRVGLISSLLLALLFGAVAAWAAVTGSVLTALVAGALLAVAVVAAYLLNQARAREAGPGAERDVAALRTEVQHAERALAEGEQQLAQLRAAVTEDARGLDMAETDLTFQQIEDVAAHLAEQDLQLVRYEQAEQVLNEAKKEADEAERAEAGREEDASAAERELERLQLSWTAWKRERGFPENLTAGGAQRFLQLARATRERLGESRRERAELERLERLVADWNATAGELLRRAGMPAADESDSEVMAAFLGLQRECEQEAVRRDRHAALTDAVRELETKTQSARRRLDDSRTALYELFAEGGADNEAAFRERTQNYEKARALERRIEERDAQISKRIGHGAEAREIRRELEVGDVTAWRAKAETAAARVEELDGSYKKAIETHKEIRLEREDLEASADIPRLEGQLERARAELDQAVERWRLLNVTRVLVEETLRAFVRDRQPQVLLDAGRSFHTVTNCGYERVIQADDGENLLVLDIAGRAKAPEQLSRGTLEQLYLCLRLGLAEEYAKRSLPMPLILDDILVNFDPVRKKRVARLLLDFAKENQILMLTCHPDTARLLADLGMANPTISVPEFEREAPA